MEKFIHFVLFLILIIIIVIRISNNIHHLHLHEAVGSKEKNVTKQTSLGPDCWTTAHTQQAFLPLHDFTVTLLPSSSTGTTRGPLLESVEPSDTTAAKSAGVGNCKSSKNREQRIQTRETERERTKK